MFGTTSRKLWPQRVPEATISRKLCRSWSDVETERPELFPAVVRDHLRTPGGQPHPVDPDVVDQSPAWALAQGLAGLVLDHVGQRAGGRGQRHVEGRDVLIVDVNAIDQAKVDHVDAQFRVDD